MWLNASQQFMVGCDTNSRDMLSHRCPNCGHAEDEESHISMTEPRLLRCAQDGSGYVLTRLLRTVRIISVILVLLLLVVTASLVFIMFGSPFLSHQSESKILQLHSLPESRSEKLQALDKVSNPSAVLTAESDTYLQWDGLHLTGDLTYCNANLTVPTKGLYYINLQVTFDFTISPPNDKCENDAISLKVTVQHFTDSYKKFVDLLVIEDTMSCKMEWTKSLHTMREFRLEENSILRVLPLHPELIRRHGVYTFFEVKRVSS